MAVQGPALFAFGNSEKGAASTLTAARTLSMKKATRAAVIDEETYKSITSLLCYVVRYTPHRL